MLPFQDTRPFQNRRDAGKKLAQKLQRYANRTDVIVCALPRGGVPVAHEVALALNVPMDVFIVRKLGLPGQEELALGVVASGGVHVLDERLIRELNIPDAVIDRISKQELKELQRCESNYRGDRPLPNIYGQIAILIDDGLATEVNMRAAVAGVRTQNPKRIVVATPAAAPKACKVFETEVDEVICLISPEPFLEISRWYANFSQITDEEVSLLLQDIWKESTTRNNAISLKID